MRPFLFPLMLGLMAISASAQDFSLNFGGGVIGHLRFDGTTLQSSVTSGPMGVGNGKFEASVRNVRLETGEAAFQYLSFAPAKGRTISVLYKDGVTTETAVSPANDRTALSDAAAVPAGVVTPVEAFDQLVNAKGCPNDLSFYDGRRVISIARAAQSENAGRLICDLTYKVTHGPGHLSPLFIKRASLQATYTAVGSQQLLKLSVSSGPFTLDVVR